MPTENAQAVIQALALIDDPTDLPAIFDAVSEAQSRANRAGLKAYVVGDTVEFDLRGGKRARGTVEKRNRKTVGVKVTHIDGEEVKYGPGYNVPPSMLAKVDA